MEILNREKLAKIVALAKRGIDNEKEIALRMVKKICEEHKLDFEVEMGNKPSKPNYGADFAWKGGWHDYPMDEAMKRYRNVRWKFESSEMEQEMLRRTKANLDAIMDFYNKKT